MNRNLHPSIIGIVGVCVSVCAVMLRAQDKPANDTRFVDKDNVIQIDHPAAWENADVTNPNVAAQWRLEKGESDPVVVLTTAVIPGNFKDEEVPLRDIENGVVKAMKKHIEDAAIVETKAATLDGQKADRCVIEGHVTGSDIMTRSVMYLCVHDGRCFSLTIAGTPEAVDKSLSQFEAVIKLVHLLK